MADAGREGPDQRDSGPSRPVAQGSCPACQGRGIKGLVACPVCAGTGSTWKGALIRAYQLGVGDGMAAMRNAQPNELDLQRDIEGLVEELKWWNEDAT